MKRPFTQEETPTKPGLLQSSILPRVYAGGAGMIERVKNKFSPDEFAQKAYVNGGKYEVNN